MADAFEKRVKRQIIGKVHRFMAVAPLGFESSLVQELEYIGIVADDSQEGAAPENEHNAAPYITKDGKVLFSAKITEAWKAVAYSRIANRILMEIGNFKAENFTQLEKKATEIPWELYLPASPLALHTTCKHSRLYHSGAIEERLKPIIDKAIKGSAEAVQSQDQYTQQLYIQFQDDRCTIWLDLAGEELYKRGHDRFVAEAPLKETIAAAMIFEASKLATNHQPLTTIVDPMAGSGTFSLEAAYIANGLIPGKCRDFALKNQPAFKEGTWNFIVKAAKEAEIPPTIITSDIDQHPIDIINHNVECGPLAEIAHNKPNAALITPQLKDFFSYTLSDIVASAAQTSPPPSASQPSTDNHQSSIILLNPPYGKRLKFDAPTLYANIARKLSEWFECAKNEEKHLTFAILIPKDECETAFLGNFSFTDLTKRPNVKRIETSHGGFSLSAIFYGV